MLQLVERLPAMLGRIDPAGLPHYRNNATALSAEIKKLDEDYRKALAGAKGRAFVTFHAAFGRLAARYGLKQKALVATGQEQFGPRQIERVVLFIRNSKAKVVFAEPQFPADRLRAIAEQTGVTIGRLDPLGNPLIEGRDGYLAMMRYNLDQLGEALAR
jgi:zinc transport system substrate-binding protein